ncbi:MAG: hypothetical protein MK108_13840 [Mariniblastus sp.]|nr:hypothetical protein [Mariniblastus sp.]
MQFKQGGIGIPDCPESQVQLQAGGQGANHRQNRGRPLQCRLAKNALPKMPCQKCLAKNALPKMPCQKKTARYSSG